MKTKKVLFAIIIMWRFQVLGQGTFSFVYDQQSAIETTGGGQGAIIQSSQPIGQSITPSLSAVGFIRLQLADPPPANGIGATLDVVLHADSLSGPVLGTTDSVSLPDGFGVGARGFADFFFSTPISVNPGTTYYFQPVIQSGDQWDLVGDAYQYGGGTAFVSGSPIPGRDFWFREGIVVPEPATWTFLLLGGSALYLRWRRR